MARTRTAAQPDERPAVSLRRATAPAGPERVVWSYLAAVVALVVVGLGFAITDGVEPAFCGSEDVSCMLGVYLLGTLVSALLGGALAAWLIRLGWEWWLVLAAVIVTMPLALDLVGPAAWALVAVAPALAALATLGGPDRRPWRPAVIGGTAGLWIAFVLAVIFVL